MSDLLHAVPVSPTDGEPVPGSAVTLEWESRGVTDSHHVQVSESDRFDRVLVDAMVGTAHSLQLLGVLPQDGRTLYWRVSSHKGAWSAPAAFQSGSRRAVARPGSSSAAFPGAGRRPAPIVAAPAATAEVPLYLRSTTGQGELVGAIVVLVALVLFLVAVLAF